VKAGAWQRLDTYARRSGPAATVLVLVLAGQVPLHLPGYAPVALGLATIAVFHFTLYRPEDMPAAAAFAAGVFEDLLGNAPLGVGALAFLVVSGLVTSQRRFLYGKSFAVVWLGFAVVSGVAAALRWVLASAYEGTIIDPLAVGFGFLTTLGAFPLLAWLLLRRQRVAATED